MTKQLKKVTFQVEAKGISVPAYTMYLCRKYSMPPQVTFQGETLQDQIDNANERISQVGFRISNKLPNGATLLKRSQAFGKSKGFLPVTIVLAEWGKPVEGATGGEFITWECYSPSMADTAQGGYFLYRGSAWKDMEAKREGSREHSKALAIADYKRRCAREDNHSL
tara:strand:- start:46 stop:546 length:501 start_codon:yes stop_codon:yes gene_type:complete